MRLSRQHLRRAWGWLAHSFEYCLLALIALAAVGRLVRDRSAAVALLLYLPVILIGAVAIIYDLARRGRALPRGRFLLATVGLLAVASEASHLVGWRRAEPGASNGTGAAREVTLVHWNVQWGGSRRGTDAPWQKVTGELAARRPNGSGVIVRVELPGDGSGDVGPRILRVLVADGRSGLRIHRTPFLSAVARACDEAARAGEPIDVVAGDFNAVSRSMGVDDIRHAGGAGGGYALASEFSGGWRGTFPAPLPLYDIDHVWVRHDVGVAGCDLFSALTATDHRGQAVRLRW